MSRLSDSTNKINDIFVYISPSINELMRAAKWTSFVLKLRRFILKIYQRTRRSKRVV